MKILVKKILNSKLVIVLEFQKPKTFLRNWSEEVFVVSKIKNTVPWIYVISDLNGEPLLEVFTKKNFKKLTKKNL